MSQLCKFLYAITLVFTLTATAVPRDFGVTAGTVLVADTQAPPGAQQQNSGNATQGQAVISPQGNGQVDASPQGSGRQVNNPEPLPPAKRYPTADEVYYVIACMEVNGKDANGLGKCSCAINALEARLPYEQFKDAQIAVTLRQAGGRTGMLRETPPMQAIVNGFTKAQRAANVECFGLGEQANSAARR